MDNCRKAPLVAAAAASTLLVLMVAVLPLLLYPALGMGMFQMTFLFREQSRTVVILGADDLPDPPLVGTARNGGTAFLPIRFG